MLQYLIPQLAGDMCRTVVCCAIKLQACLCQGPTAFGIFQFVLLTRHSHRSGQTIMPVPK